MIAPNEKIEDFIIRVDQERLAVAYDTQYRNRLRNISAITDAQNELSRATAKTPSPVKVTESVPVTSSAKPVKRTRTAAGSAQQTADKALQVVGDRAINGDIKIRADRNKGYGFAGRIGEDGLAHVEAVPIGANGINTVEEARAHFANGGDIAEIPDPFLREMFVGTDVLAHPDGERGHVVVVPPFDDRFKGVRPGGAVGDNLLFIDGQGAEGAGFFVKQGAKVKENAHELMGIELAHQMGIPVLPGRYDGVFTGQGIIDGRRTLRAVVMEHGMNAVEGGQVVPDFNVRLADLDAAHGYGLQARIPHFMVNFYMQVVDRHDGNGILGRDKDGNWIAIPIDLARAGWIDAPKIEDYALQFRGMDRMMTRPGLVGQAIAAAGDAARRQQLKGEVRAAIAASRKGAEDYVAREEEVVADHMARLRALGADSSEVRQTVQALRDRFKGIRKVLSQNSLEQLYTYFGV